MPTRFASSVFTLYCIAFRSDKKTRLSGFSMKSNGTELEQVFHTDRRSCQTGWPREFGDLNSVLAAEFVLPLQWILVLTLTYSLPLGCEYLFTLHQSVAKTQTNMRRSTFKIGAAQLRYVTETASKSLLLNVNWISIRLGFRVGARAISRDPAA